MARKQFEVPFNRDGALMHYARQGGSYDQAHEWRMAEPIEMTLTIDRISRGRSAAYFLALDWHGRLWPIFMAELLELLQQSTVVKGTVEGSWIPCKRGQNYGLRYLGPVQAADPIKDFTDRMMQL